MTEPVLQVAALALLLPIASAIQSGSLSRSSKPPDASLSTVPFVHVETTVQIEVPAWSGSGQPLIFMAGLDFDARVANTFAAKFASSYQVYAITRRDFGATGTRVPVVRSNEDMTRAKNAFLTNLP